MCCKGIGVDRTICTTGFCDWNGVRQEINNAIRKDVDLFHLATLLFEHAQMLLMILHQYPNMKEDLRDSDVYALTIVKIRH